MPFKVPEALVQVARAVANSSLRFLAPGLIVAATAASVVVAYTPLVFEPPQQAAAQSETSSIGDPITADEAKSSDDAKDTDSSKTSSSAADVDASALKDGTYTGYDECAESGVFDYYLALDVTVSGGKVTNVGNVRGGMSSSSGSLSGSYDTRNDEYIGWAANGKSGATGVVDQIMSDAKNGTITSSVDTVSGATYSSDSILRAYHNALKKAQGKSAPVASASKKADNSKKSSKKAKSKKSKSKSSVDKNTELADGKFTGYDRCTEDDIFDYFLALDVTVKKGKVTKVDNVRSTMKNASGTTIPGSYDTANDVYLNWAKSGRNSQTGVLTQIMKDVKAGKITQSIDTVSGATFSSNSILDAYTDALQKSAKKAGSKVKTPAKTDSSSSSSSESKPAVTPTPTPAPTVSDDEKLVDGSYTAYAFCEDTANPSAYYPYYIGATIQVTNGKVASLTSVFGDAEGVVDSRYKYSAGQNKTYLDRAMNGYGIGGRHPGVMKQINTSLAAGTIPTTYDAISGATYSSVSIWEAFVQAVKDAQAASKGSASNALNASAPTGNDSAGSGE